MYSNRFICDRFANGGTRGRSYAMSIDGDKMWSYGACIAIRYPDRFVLSNRAKFLGGRICTCTTSWHLRVLVERLEGVKPIMLVDGWADEGTEEYIRPEIPTHKTFWGLLRGIRCKTWDKEMWIGKWTGSEAKVDFRFRNGKLYDKNGRVIAAREIVHTRGYSYENRCLKNCDVCPARWECLTEEHYWGVVFFVVKGTKYTKRCTRLLSPSSLVDSIDEALCGIRR